MSLNRFSKSRGQGRSRRGAFTLIELMLVMAIIAILAGIILPKFVGRMEDSKKKAAIGQVSMLRTALNTFEVDNGRFPTSEEGLQALVSNPGNLTDWKQLMDKVPVDPWGHPYVYKLAADASGFDVYSCGPDGQDQNGGGDNIGSANAK
jgi:general secretion pathway protein G